MCRPPLRAFSLALLLCALAPACGTIAEGNGGAENLPSRGITPFEKLTPPELGEEEERDPEDPAGRWPFVLLDDTLEFTEPHAMVSDAETVLYVSGCDEDDRCAIYRATAPDGLTFDAPVEVLAPPEWAGGHVSAPTVRAESGGFTLWFVGGTDEPALGRARSSDGVRWTLDAEPVFVPPTGRLGSAAVVHDGSGYLLYYASSGLGISLDEDEPDENVERAFGIARATSRDGIEWTANGIVLPLGVDCLNEAGVETRCWDEQLVAAPGPRVSRSSAGRQRIDLWYAGARTRNSGIGFAGSYDGLTFSRYDLNPVVNGSGPETAPFVVAVEDELWMYYADERSGRGAIAVAIHRAD